MSELEELRVVEVPIGAGAVVRCGLPAAREMRRAAESQPLARFLRIVCRARGVEGGFAPPHFNLGPPPWVRSNGNQRRRRPTSARDPRGLPHDRGAASLRRARVKEKHERVPRGGGLTLG